ncbi:hypothetical protein DFH28DRAFT_934177 [Melampsora americana]|nr:hypothetical protein DFH28DRAFT_934177 [Melampsora americana]
MSAKNYSSSLEGKDILTRSQTTRSSTQSQTVNSDLESAKGPNKKGKKTTLSNIEENDEQGEGGEGAIEERHNRQDTHDPEVQGTGNPMRDVPDNGNETGRRDDGGIESDDNIAGLGPDIETFEEAPHIEHGHSKWIRNIRGAEEYQFWCERENTEVRDIELMEHHYEPVGQGNIETSNENIKEISKSRNDTNTTMEYGMLPENDMIALSKYFDDVMRNKNIHMPVSIFDPVWILQDSNHMKTRSNKTNCLANVIVYVGMPYVNEYRLTHTQWSTRFDLMVKYQEEKYDILDSQKHSPIAPRLRAHKENVLALMRKYYGKWPPAMRYDIAHRRNCWENWLPSGAMADVGTMNKDLAEQAKEDSQHFGDYKYIDNPYAFGMAMQNISPINGETYPAHAPWDSTGALVDTHADMLTGRNISAVTNQPINQMMIQNTGANGAVRHNKYLGKHYNPFYSRNSNQNNAPHHNTPYNHSAYYSNSNTGNGVSSGVGGMTAFRGGRGSNRGSRGSHGGRGGVRPLIGPGSFDKTKVPTFQPGGSGNTPTENTNMLDKTVLRDT